MTTMDFYTTYRSQGISIRNLFDTAGEGLVVPLYQREYTWEAENIDQLLDDIIVGIRGFVANDSDIGATFLGTVILTSMPDDTLGTLLADPRARPTAAQIVIDGQQRLATIAMLAIVLADRLTTLAGTLPSVGPYVILRNHSDDLIDELRKLYAIKLGRGADPSLKPKVIRDHKDRWEYKGSDHSYQSFVARYIATYIRTCDAAKALSSIDSMGGRRIVGNIKTINQWLDDICRAHVPGTPLYEQMPVGPKVGRDEIQERILGYPNDELKRIVEETKTNASEAGYRAVAIYGIFLFSFYLLHRCGVNRLQAAHEEWGFDMFQALNTTGTSLTAMETFLPQVMQVEQTHGEGWINSQSRAFMGEVKRLLEATASNQNKNQRTNELLRSFALCQDGEKLGNKFSVQRRWMTRVYKKRARSLADRRQVVHNLAEVAKFFRHAWYMDGRDGADYIKGLDGHPKRKLASFLVQYLKDAKSKLSAPILARFYSEALANSASVGEFVEAAKACAAFFTLWRTARTTSGLDDVYRRFFKGSEEPVLIDGQSWAERARSISARCLKRYFVDVLEHKGIGGRDAWMVASERFLLYTEVKAVCRFVLFVAGHDRIADDDEPGLTKGGNVRVCPLLELRQWRSTAFRSLEHVAPQRRQVGHDWDDEIYNGDRVDEPGNLLLLPTDINQYADNKQWAVKYLYYSHVGERAQDKIDELRALARDRGYNLGAKTISVLSASEYNCVVEPVVGLGIDGEWNAELIDRRTKQMKEIVWDTLMSWLTSSPPT